MQAIKGPRAGIEAYVLALALLVPLGLMGAAVSELAGLNVRLPSNSMQADSNQALIASRPAPSRPAPPPTLVAPTATPEPTQVPPTPTVAPTPLPRTYTVQRGDELKQIAAMYGVTIWKIIDANEIPNPDSLRVGQQLTIPDN